MLGGAAVHFSLAASFFTEVRPVGPVGDDFGAAEFAVLESRGDARPTTSSGSRAASRSSGAAATSTTSTSPTPRTPSSASSASSSRSSRDAVARRPTSLFLANIQPDLQRQVRAQCAEARFSALDSMNLWIETAKDSLLAAIAEVDCVIVNDAEIRQLTGESNLARGARGDDGPRARARSSPSRASTAPRCSPRTASSRCPASRSRTCATRPAPATASPAASSATSTATPASSTRPACGGRWATARCSPPSTSRSSAPSGSSRLSREEIEERFEELRRDDPIRRRSRPPASSPRRHRAGQSEKAELRYWILDQSGPEEG